MQINRKTRALGALVGFLGAFGGMGVMATGLRFYAHLSMGQIALWCLVAALLTAVLSGRKGAFLLPLALGLFTLFAWKGLRLDRSLEALLYFVSRMYRSGYGWALIRWSDDPLTYGDALRAFCFLGAWLSMAITFGYLSRGGVWLGAFCAALPLIPCLVLTDSVPEEKWLFLQLLSLLLLLFCSKNPKRGFYVTLPVALALGCMFLLMPQDSYHGQDAAERVWTWLEEKFTQADPEGGTDTPVVTPDLQGQQINLSNTGPRPRWMVPVMYVTAQETGTLYLRSLAFDGYTGSRWQLDEEDAQFPLFSTEGLSNTLTVETLSLHDTLYLPYGATIVYNRPQVLEHHIRGMVKNTFQVTTYEVFYKTPDLWQIPRSSLILGFSGIIPEDIYTYPLNGEVTQVESVWARYLALPEETRARAQAWLDSHIPADTGSKWETAQIICDLVSQSASYDLSTRRMPVGEDFAMWFLEESETGYCVHFASAAAVLLRAAGIPSRYVSGYLVSTVAGEQVTVYQKNAHAWVEVFIEGAGWVMLEATPGDGVENTLSDTVPTEETTQPTETTLPPETTEAPEATKPSLTTPTEPSQTTPSGAQQPQTPGSSQQKKPLPQWVKGLLWVPVVLAALWGQWKLRRQLWKRWQRKGSQNQQVLKLWREATLVGKVLGQKPPEDFFQLAQKAKFSQYALTSQERLQAAHHLESLHKQLRTAPLWRKFLGFLLALP